MRELEGILAVERRVRTECADRDNPDNQCRRTDLVDDAIDQDSQAYRSGLHQIVDTRGVDYKGTELRARPVRYTSQAGRRFRGTWQRGTQNTPPIITAV